MSRTEFLTRIHQGLVIKKGMVLKYEPVKPGDGVVGLWE